MKELNLEQLNNIKGSGVCAGATLAVLAASIVVPGLGFFGAAVTLTCAAIEISQEDWWKSGA